MAFDEFISMHQTCLSIWGYTFSCDRVHSLEWLLTESAIFVFRLNSNMLNISFVMDMFSNQN